MYHTELHCHVAKAETLGSRAAQAAGGPAMQMADATCMLGALQICPQNIARELPRCGGGVVSRSWKEVRQEG